MQTLISFAIEERYRKVANIGDRLGMVNKIIDWDVFRPILSKMYNNNTPKGGRPHCDEIVMLKVLLLQSWYSLSDQEVEYQIADRISFQHFIGTHNPVPDYSTIWRFRERIAENNLQKKIWNELMRQMEKKGLIVKKGHIQDATFIEADPGRKRYQKEKKGEKEGERIKYTPKQLSHIDRDGSFSIKNGQVHYGYKGHTKSDIDFQLIREFDLSTASLHDSQVDLSEDGDIAIYRDKGYAGVPVGADGVSDFTMEKAYRNRPLKEGQKFRNRMISGIRSVGERPYAVMKRVFKGGRTCLKTLHRVKVQFLMACFGFNAYQLCTLRLKGVIA